MSKHSTPPPPVAPEAQALVRDAKEKLSAAQKKLEEVLRHVKQVERADKTMISHALQEAFDELALAKVELETLLG